MPTSTRLASQTTSLAYSEAITRAASAGETSVTMSSSPSVEIQRSNAWAGVRSLRKFARSSRGPRSMFQWLRFASRTRRGDLSSLSMMPALAKGLALIITTRWLIVEYPSVRVNGPVPHGPGASIAHQWPSPLPNLAYPKPCSRQKAELAMWKPRILPRARPYRSGKVEADGVVIYHFAGRFWGEVKPGSWWMWSRPTLHLIEILLDTMRSERFPILKAHPYAQLKFEGMVVRPTCASREGVDDAPILVHADWFLHCVPGDK